MENISDNDIEDPVMLSYDTICDIIKLVLKDTKILYNFKKEAQPISNALEGEVSVNVPQLHEVPDLTYRPIESQSLIKCNQPLWPKYKPRILYWDWSSNMSIRGKPKGLAISKIKCKAVWKYLLLFD